MTLLVEAGSATSNSFATLTEAATYLTQLPIDTAVITAWNTLTTPVKEFRMRMATDLIGDLFTFQGFPAYDMQRLAFPRALCQELYGIPLTEIPEDIKMVQVYIACVVISQSLANASETGSEQTSSGEEEVSMVSIKGVSVQFRGGSVGKRFSSVLDDVIRDAHSIVSILLGRYVTQIKTRVPSTFIKLEALATTTSTTTTTTTTTSTTTTSTSSTTTSTTTSA